MRPLDLPGRSTTIARNGMAATSHVIATQTAVEVLKDGGNAMDAAIAACAVQGVVEPGSTGIGGDCFALYSAGGGSDITAFNGSGWAPAAATPTALRALGVTSIERQSAHAVTVPGAVDAWDQLLRRHGTRPLSALLEPAIRYAEEGFAVMQRSQADWANQESLLRGEANAARIYLVDNAAPAVGAVHRFPEMAQSLRQIAAEGRDAFYRGSLARGMVDYLQSRGGLHTLDDFARYQGRFETPIRGRFRDVEVVECPPNGQGVIALLILNILSRFPVDPDPLSPARLQLEVDATRLAYSVRNALVADSAHATVDVEHLLSDGLADELAARIRTGQVGQDGGYTPPAAHKDTVYLTVVDKDRNCVSFINSIFTNFGSGQVAPGGILLHNRGMGFELQEGHPNAIGPHKRPLHTIIPAMVVKDGRCVLPFGVMGGQYQAMGHAHFVSKWLDYGLDIQEIIDLPRLFPLPGSTQVDTEARLGSEVRERLQAAGYQCVTPKLPLGGAQAIWIDWERGVLHGASDPRKDGCALGY